LLADSIPGAEFALLPDARHFPFVEDRAEFDRAVRPFLLPPATA
jgi:pimeloyl-ACP methyl ester carboxylesterase